MSAFEGENKTTIPAEIISIVENFLEHDLLLNLFYPNDNAGFIEETEETEEEAEGILLQIEEHSAINELEFIRELKSKTLNLKLLLAIF